MSEFILKNYLELLKTLKKVKSSDEKQKNIEKIQQVLGISDADLEKLKFPINSPDREQWRYPYYLYFVISTFIDNVNLDSTEKSELLAMNDLNNLFSIIQEYSDHSLKQLFNKQKDSTKIPEAITYRTSLNANQVEILKTTIDNFTKIYNIKTVASAKILEDNRIDYIIGILWLISSSQTSSDVDKYQNYLKECYLQFAPEFMFKQLLLIKGFFGFSREFHMVVHKELMRKIRHPDGFHIFCKTLLSQTSSQNPVWKVSETIATIAATAIQGQSIGNIFNTLKSSILNEEDDITGACVCTLKKIYEKKPESIEKTVVEKFNSLVNPDVVLQGAILMEHDEIRYLIDFYHALFSGSMVSLPTKILVPYINVIYQFYIMLPDEFQKHKLQNILIFTLSNRNSTELRKVLEKLLLKQENTEFLDIHPKIIVKEGINSLYSVQIGTPENKFQDDSEEFLGILKNSNNNLLVYQIFLETLKLIEENYNDGSNETNLIEGSLENEELGELLSSKFYKKLVLLEIISNLVQLKSIYSQFNENPKEVLTVILKILEKSCKSESKSDDRILIMLFSVYREFVFKLKNVEQQKSYLQEAKKLKILCKNQDVKDQIDSLFDWKQKPKEIGMDYKDALSLLGENETHCKVYGINLLIKLLEKKDTQTVANKHSVLAIALEQLKDPESYSFLNVIRLLVTLTNFLESEVVDALIQQYKSQELEIDERLKIGEVILKVTELMGEISYKYKDVLINCFLLGCRDKHDEFRASSLVNLGNICKILTYQIHNFFNELHQLLESTITSDPYLPSKRAAVMVLAQTLAGLNNLMDFQDYLLPIYRLLKHVLSQESDPQTRIHAEIALEHLREKIKKFLNPDQDFKKEIKIILDDEDIPKKKDIVFK